MLLRFGSRRGLQAAQGERCGSARQKTSVGVRSGQGQGKGVSSESSAVISSQLTIAHRMLPFLLARRSLHGRLSSAVAAELRYGSARVGRRSSTPKTHTKQTRS